MAGPRNCVCLRRSREHSIREALHVSAVAFSCSACSKQFRVLPEQAGRRVRCPHCETPNSIPASIFAATEPDPHQSPDTPDLAGRIEHLAASVNHSFKRSKHPDATTPWRSLRPLQFTHSRFARVVGIVSRVTFFLALGATLYVIALPGWEHVMALPFLDALLMIALRFLPSVCIALVGIVLLAVAQCVEYLARMSES